MNWHESLTKTNHFASMMNRVNDRVGSTLNMNTKHSTVQYGTKHVEGLLLSFFFLISCLWRFDLITKEMDSHGQKGQLSTYNSIRKCRLELGEYGQASNYLKLMFKYFI